ncbi:MAG: lipoate--protein ligase family protein [Gemmatimonadetes bacterium]|nr:lipoate--protein ligase family protein [Gemmatimonadota bacterium]
MSHPIRLVDCGSVPALRSQTVFHAVAYAMTPETPDTILLVAPGEPYVSVGFHQDVDKEVDLDRCRELGIPVIRREVGGGAVYLDGNQLFCQWIFQQGRLPAMLEDRFALYVTPLVETYRSLGVQAEYRPVNDVHVNGRKIGGTGAALIGSADVLVGSLMFDFDVDTMAQVLQVPSEKFRDKVHQGLREYMTTLRRELGTPPGRDEVVRAYVDACSAALGRAVEPGPLTAAETAMAEELDGRFASDEWLFSAGGLRKHGVKIHEDVHIREAVHKAPGGLIRATAQLRHGRIADVAFTGDFTLQPGSLVASLERELRGTPLEAAPVGACIDRFYDRYRPQSPGLEPGDWSEALIKLAASPETGP